MAEGLLAVVIFIIVIYQREGEIERERERERENTCKSFYMSVYQTNRFL